MIALPSDMTVIEIVEPGGPMVLQPATRSVPCPGNGEVLIKVAAAGVNRPDVMQRQGLYPPPPGASEIPGLEVSGEIVALGDEVSRLAIGQTVCALVSGGGYAQFCLASAALCLPVPDNLSLKEAAALPETFFTVWTNVFDRGRLGDGESLLVHGGASGIGTTAIQLARAFGATVYATAGSAAKCEFCESLGCEAAINYRDEDFVERIKVLTARRGVDVILDMIGGDYLPRNLKCLALEGRLVQIALQHGPKSEINLVPLMLNRLTVTGSTLRPRSVEQKQVIAESLLERVWPLINAGQVRPIMDSDFPLSCASAAHELMERGTHTGKIVLVN